MDNPAITEAQNTDFFSFLIVNWTL